MMRQPIVGSRKTGAFRGEQRERERPWRRGVGNACLCLAKRIALAVTAVAEVEVVDGCDDVQNVEKQSKT